MPSSKKITDEELRNEIRKSKSMKEIAYEYGYSHPSGTLHQRIRSLGFEKLNKLNMMETGASLSLNKGQISKIRERKGIDGQLFFDRKVKDNGDVVLEFHDSEYIQEDEQVE